MTLPEHLSQSNQTLTATALLVHHSRQLSHWGINGQSRYGQALAGYIATQAHGEREKIMNRALLVAIHNRAIDGQRETLSTITDDMSETDQKATFEKLMSYQAIIEKSAAAING